MQDHTFSKTYALYRAAFYSEEVVADPKNTSLDTLSDDEQLLTDWLTAARFSSREQLMSATGLGAYDVGRIGLHAARWGIEPRYDWLAALEKLDVAAAA